MPEDYFDLAYINFNKVILHGRKADQTEVDRELSLKEREEVGRLRQQHDEEMQKLLRRLAA
jgi:hypothetical protein